MLPISLPVVCLLQAHNAQVRHNPRDGSIDAVVHLPVPNPTCVALGGPGLTTLFITTARRKMTEKQLEEMPFAGGLFAAEVPVPGLREPEFVS